MKKLKKLKKDKERGARYGAEMAINSLIPPNVENCDRGKMKSLQVQCKLAGCYNKAQVWWSNKNCTYYKVPADKLQCIIDARLWELYPTCYGEFLIVFYSLIFWLKIFFLLFNCWWDVIVLVSISLYYFMYHVNLFLVFFICG